MILKKKILIIDKFNIKIREFLLYSHKLKEVFSTLLLKPVN